MSLKSINAAIHKLDPCVTLHKGEGYHYYEFDNGDWSQGKDAGFKPVAGYLVGDDLVCDTESVYVTYTSHVEDKNWIEDGFAFGQKVRAEYGLPGVIV